MHVLSFDGKSWTVQDMDAAAVHPQVTEDKLTWIRAGGASSEDLERLCQDFSIHPLAIEDVQSERQRPKVEDYEDLTFAMVRVPQWHDDLTWRHVGLFQGKDFLITASSMPIAELDAVEKRLLARGLPAYGNDASTLLHMTLDELVDAWFPFIDDLEEHIEELEETASTQADRETLADIREAKQVVSRTRKVSGPMREAMVNLERGDHPHVGAETKIYLRDVSDHMVRIAERLEHVKEMAMFAQEGWNASLANQQNQVMKRLTVVAALLLFPGLIAGLGGMNFEIGFPNWAYWPVVAGIFTFIAAGFGIAAWKRWL